VPPKQSCCFGAPSSLRVRESQVTWTSRKHHRVTDKCPSLEIPRRSRYSISLKYHRPKRSELLCFSLCSDTQKSRYHVNYSEYVLSDCGGAWDCAAASGVQNIVARYACIIHRVIHCKLSACAVETKITRHPLKKSPATPPTVQNENYCSSGSHHSKNVLKNRSCTRIGMCAAHNTSVDY